VSQDNGTVTGSSNDANLAGVLADSLERLVPTWPDARLCIALSGGVDSVALLHAARDLAAHHAAVRLRALHVDHGLQPASGEWAAFCRESCGRLAVPCEVLELRLAPRKGESVEAEARRERYAALAAALQPGEYLLTAHHADDQLETVLLQLFRGAGVAGLAAMPEYAPLGPGYHLRPLLQVARADLVAHADAVGLQWIDDPMNRESRYDRSYLRHEVLPAILGRWPAVARTVGRSARHLAEAQRLLEVLAETDAGPLLDEDGTLELKGLKALPRGRQVNLLRWWIVRQGLGLPSTARLESILRDVVPARPDAHPVVEWPTGEVRRRKGRLVAQQAS
jgi:tRNA(Ile)-lysidine synthase